MTDGLPWALSQVQAARLVVEERGRRDRLERARTFLHAHAAEPIDLDRVAREAYLSPFHFLREFRREFELTPHQYLVRRRMERAQELLLETDRSVTEICFEVGYSSVGSFSAAFQKHVGHSPSRYRRRVFASAELRALPPIPACFLLRFAPAAAP